MELTLQTIMTLVAIAGSLAALVVSLRRAPAQIKLDEGSAAESLASAAKQAADTATGLLGGLQHRLDDIERTARDLEQVITALKADNADMRTMIENLERRVDSWRTFGLELTRQLRALGHEPSVAPPE